MDALLDRPARFVANLDHLDVHGQVESVWTEVFETFGSFARPDRKTSHLWTLTLHGVTAQGATEDEAIANWKRLVRRIHGLDGGLGGGPVSGVA